MKAWVTAVTALLVASCTGTQERVLQSPNYRDGEFRNLYHDLEAEKLGFWTALKSLKLGKQEPWPEWRETPSFKPQWAKLEGSAGEVVLLGHASVLVRFEGLNILIDPHYSLRASPLPFGPAKRARANAIAFEDLPPIDLVLITHDHFDHLDLPTLKRLAQTHHPRFVAGLGHQALLSDIGITDLIELDWWETLEYQGAGIHFLPAQHFSSRSILSRKQRLWGSFLIEKKGKKIYHAGDTAIGPHFKLIGERLGPIDLSLIPIGAYAPRDFMRHFHLDPPEAVAAHLELNSKKSLAMHYGFFMLTLEGIDQPLEAFALARQTLSQPESFLAPPYGELVAF